jgi:iron complex outermembrane recepter protein
MVQRATRAPSVNELFQPAVTGLSNVAQDPCQGANINQAEANTAGTLSNLCRLTGVPVAAIGQLPPPAASQINVLTGGNLALGPEVADTFTVGFVWQPHFVDNLSIMFDFWDIQLEQEISDPSSADILEGCYSATRNPGRTMNEFCQLVGRSPTSGDLNAGDAVGVRLLRSNLGWTETDGFDLGISYMFALGDLGMNPDFGRIHLAFNGTRVRNFEFQSTPTATLRDCLGHYSVACARPIHQTKWNQRTTWAISNFDVSLNWRRLSSLRVEPLAAAAVPGGQGFLPAYSSIDAYDYFDLAAAWQPTDNVRVGITVNNLLDKSPPQVGNTIGSTSYNSGNTYPQFYDPIGRFFILGVDWKL